MLPRFDQGRLLLGYRTIAQCRTRNDFDNPPNAHGVPAIMNTDPAAAGDQYESESCVSALAVCAPLGLQIPCAA